MNREIKYDRTTRNYAMTLDGNLIGFASTHHDAEVALNAHVYELLMDRSMATATELDGGATPDEPPPDDAPGSDEDGAPQADIDFSHDKPIALQTPPTLPDVYFQSYRMAKM